MLLSIKKRWLKASTSSSFLGVDFKTPEDAENAVLSWYSAYEGAFTRAKPDATTEENTGNKARDAVKNQWIATLKGVVSKKEEAPPPPNKKSVIKSINKI